MIFDVRFLSNPYNFDNMRDFIGNNSIINNYIFSLKSLKIFLSKTIDLLLFLISKIYKRKKKLFKYIDWMCWWKT